jgi:hypothetical protein
MRCLFPLRRGRASVLALVVVLGLMGCGSSGPQTVPTQGVVTLAGGAWPGPGTIQFTPVGPAPGFPLRPGSGDFKADGAFKVTSFAPGDGLVPGKYEVSVECWKSQPQMGPNGLIPGESAVPPKFREGKTSGWVVEVPPGGSPLNLKYDAAK